MSKSINAFRNRTVAEASIEELQAELERKIKEKKELVKPEVLATPDFSKVIGMAKGYIDELESEDFYDEDNDFARYLYEEALKAVYGPKIFDYINKKNKSMGR